MGMILGWMFGAFEGAAVMAALWYVWWDKYKKRPPKVQYVYVAYPVQVSYPKHRRETYDYVTGEVIDNGMPQLSRGIRPYRNPLEMSALWPKA